MHHAGTALEDPRLRNLTNRKICSNLFLQQLLYYQFFFDIAWITFWIAWLFAHYWHGLSYRDDDVVRMVFMFLWGVFEPIRLVAGWYGNMQENLPWLVLFVILSFAPLHVTVYYMMIASFDIGPVARSVQYCQAALLDTEALVGIYAAFRMYKLQKQQYYLFEYVMNQRRRNDAYRLENSNSQSQGGAGGGIGRSGQRK